MKLGLAGRPTADVLLIMIAGTICFTVIMSGGTVAVIEIIHPEVDTSQAFAAISDVINTLIGLLAGFLAGRTEGTMRERERTDPK